MRTILACTVLGTLLLLAACGASVKGNMALSGGDYAGAEAEFKQALAADPTDMLALHKLALTYLRWGKFDQAEATARKALAVKPGEPLSTMYLGLALFGQGRRDEGVATMESYNDPGKPWVTKSVVGAAGSLRGNPGITPAQAVSLMEGALASGVEMQRQRDYISVRG